MSSQNPLQAIPTSPHALIERIGLERARWFDQNILPHEKTLRVWLHRRRLSAMDIDDTIQETYAVLASRPRLDDIAYPKAYLFRITHSLILRDARRSRIVPFESIDDLAAVDEARDPFSPERIAIGREEMRLLAIAIQAMPTRVRAAFVLRRVHGYSQREIAGKMKISESTVEKHIAKGLTLLIERFVRSGNEPLESHRDVKRRKHSLVQGPRDPSNDR